MAKNYQYNFVVQSFPLDEHILTDDVAIADMLNNFVSDFPRKIESTAVKYSGDWEVVSHSVAVQNKRMMVSVLIRQIQR